MSAEEFKKQYLPYQQKLYRIAIRLLEDSFEAEDIVQETFIKLWDKRDDLHHIDNCESYCIRMVKNLCLDVLRSKRNKTNQPIDEADITENEQVTGQIEIKEDLDHLNYLMELLPEQQKRVLELKHYEGYSTEEIEEITGFSSVHIRVLLSRGRKRIRELFAGK